MKNLKITEAMHKRLKLLATYHDVGISEYAEAACNVAMRHEQEVLAELMLQRETVQQPADDKNQA